MGRFWQSRLLAEWNPAFEHLPIANMIWENQSAYYKAIEESTENTDSGIFVDFMLEVILNAIKSRNDPVTDPVNDIILLIKGNKNITYDELAKKTGKSRKTISRILAELKNDGTIKRVGADKNGWWEVTE